VYARFRRTRFRDRAIIAGALSRDAGTEKTPVSGDALSLSLSHSTKSRGRRSKERTAGAREGGGGEWWCSTPTRIYERRNAYSACRFGQ